MCRGAELDLDKAQNSNAPRRRLYMYIDLMYIIYYIYDNARTRTCTHMPRRTGPI
jgi:hypothetical protein